MEIRSVCHPPPYGLFIAAALFVILVICRILSYIHKKRKINAQIRHEKERAEQNERVVNDRIASFNKLAQGAMNEAAELYDEVTPERINRLVDDVQERLHAAGTYDEALAITSDGIRRLKTLITDMRKHAEQLKKDAEEEGRRRTQYKMQHPYGNTVYFKACKDAEAIKKTFRQLAKIYHPDVPGGDEKIYMKIQAEYQHQIQGTG